MATKKQNRNLYRRRVRRALNKALDFFKGASGRRLHTNGYGRGISSSDLRRTERED